jgi:hypothetical protein
MTTQSDDSILWGAKDIGRAANVLRSDGEVDMRRVFYLLERGYLPGKKCGRVWTSTLRRLRQVLEPAA